ncbi:MAG: FtsQ-type POTRA domain-containing protein [Candidatus Alcyoniella australis]|nr:FtsQ-type POTRA domain-containing protein [Candidatus Alcyoniella australis]
MFDFREHKRRQLRAKRAKFRLRSRVRGLLRDLHEGFWPFMRKAVPTVLILALVGWAGLAAATGELFRVRDVRISGLRHVPRTEVIGLLGLSADQHLFDVDLQELRERLQRNHWIEDARVARELPDRLIVDVVEQQVLAVARMEQDYYVNPQGMLFKEVEPGESHDFILISGLREADFAANQSEALFSLAEAVELIRVAQLSDESELSDLSEVHYDPVRGLSMVTLDHGIWIEMGRGGFAEKLERLEALHAALGSRAARLSWTDVSVPQRAFIRLKTTGGRR